MPDAISSVRGPPANAGREPTSVAPSISIAKAVAGRRRKRSLMTVTAGSHPPRVVPMATRGSVTRYPVAPPHSPAAVRPTPARGSPSSIARRAPKRREISQPATGISRDERGSGLNHHGRTLSPSCVMASASARAATMMAAANSRQP